MSAACKECGVPADTPAGAHDLIHQLYRSLAEARRVNGLRAAAERMVQTYQNWLAGCAADTRWKEVMAAHINLRDTLASVHETSHQPGSLPPVFVMGNGSFEDWYEGYFYGCVRPGGVETDRLRHAFEGGELRHQSCTKSPDPDGDRLGPHILREDDMGNYYVDDDGKPGL